MVNYYRGSRRPRNRDSPYFRGLSLFLAPLSLLIAGVLYAGPRAEVTLHPRGRAPVTVAVEVADTPTARARGLMYRRHLPRGEGMWFVFDTDVRHPFWMKNTYLSLDLIFVGADERVVDIIANAQPNSEASLMPRAPYRYVLEVPAGFARRHRIGFGDRVRIKDRS